ncbi:MAG: hypothetical protein ACLTSX_08310 [Collinsella sp.]
MQKRRRARARVPGNDQSAGMSSIAIDDATDHRRPACDHPREVSFRRRRRGGPLGRGPERDPHPSRVISSKIDAGMVHAIKRGTVILGDPASPAMSPIACRPTTIAVGTTGSPRDLAHRQVPGVVDYEAQALETGEITAPRGRWCSRIWSTAPPTPSTACTSMAPPRIPAASAATRSSAVTVMAGEVKLSQRAAPLKAGDHFAATSTCDTTSRSKVA